jgi:cytochrome c556
MDHKRFGLGVFAFIIATSLVAGAAEAPDTRVSLDLNPAQQEALKATMREHLSALEAIVDALGREDYDKAAALAHNELGFPKHHEAMQREMGAGFPNAYMDLAMAHHQAAEDLSGAIEGKDADSILKQLAKTIHACTACHGAFKL